MKSSTDDAMKTSAFIADGLLDLAISLSEEPSDVPSLRLFRTRSYFDYIYAPGNEYLEAGFEDASAESETVVPGGFPWETLPKGTKIVNVGGGVGNACREITRKNPLHMTFRIFRMWLNRPLRWVPQDVDRKASGPERVLGDYVQVMEASGW